MVKIPILTEIVNKEYVFVDDFMCNNEVLLKAGTRFKITKLKYDRVEIKVTSTFEESGENIKIIADYNVKRIQNDLDGLDHAITLWTTEGDLFQTTTKETTMINTGNFVKDEVTNERCDLEYTHMYRHTKGKTSIYSYYNGENIWYSKAVYERIRLGELAEIKGYRKLYKNIAKDIYRGLISKRSYDVHDINNANFVEVDG
jgi:hypothetical protein